MPVDRFAPTTRRGAAPAHARPVLLAAAWTGAGTAIVAAIVSSAVVAICWLPAAGRAGNAGSAIRAGVLTFLAGVHGGITVDGLTSAFVPLGLTGLIALLAWRAGAALGGTVADLGVDQPRLVVQAAILQASAFALTCGMAAGAARLGTSHVPVIPAVVAAFLLFAVPAGVALARRSALSGDVAERLPPWLRPALRAAAAALCVYLGAGALLVAGSLVTHHTAVEALSREIGGGWSGAPVLLLGILAAPNAAIAAAAYLAGPGFALGHGSGVALSSATHGTLPAFPMLGAVPHGPATTLVWLLTAATPVLAGVCMARIVAATASTWREQLRTLAAATAATVLIGIVLGWQGGGAIGSGRLSAIGASPWQFGLAAGAGAAAVAAMTLVGLGAIAWWRKRDDGLGPAVRATLAAVGSVRARSSPDVEVKDEDVDLAAANAAAADGDGVRTAVSAVAETPDPDRGDQLAG